MLPIPKESRPQSPQEREAYLTELSPNSEKPIQISKDENGNKVFTFGEEQATPLGLVPQEIVISKDGEALIKRHPGLLRKLQNGEVVGTLLGQGSEGDILELNVGNKQYVIKYVYPSSADTQFEDHKNLMFTPQTTQMRAMQQIQSISEPLPFTVISPIIATTNLTVMEQIPDHSPLWEINKGQEPPRAWTEIPQTKRELIESLLTQENLEPHFQQIADLIRENISPKPSDAQNLANIADEGYANLSIDIAGLQKGLSNIPLEEITYKLLKPYLFLTEVLVFMKIQDVTK